MVQIAPSVTVSKLGALPVGKGEERLGIAQRPAIADGHVYAAGRRRCIGIRPAQRPVAVALSHLGAAAHRRSGCRRRPGGRGQPTGDVIALDAATGAEKWKSKVANEVLVAGDRRQHGVRIPTMAASPRRCRQRRGAAGSTAPTCLLTVRGNGAITLGPGIVFVGNDNGTLTALSMTDGGVVWTTPVAQPDGRSELERMADVDGPAVLDNTTLYATSYRTTPWRSTAQRAAS